MYNNANKIIPVDKMWLQQHQGKVAEVMWEHYRDIYLPYPLSEQEFISIKAAFLFAVSGILGYQACLLKNKISFNVFVQATKTELEAAVEQLANMTD